MKLYIDSEYRCHTTNPDGIFREIETPSLDGKCTTFIKGCRFVPAGENWTRSDGEVFQGEMLTQWKPYEELDSAQREYERAKLAKLENIQNELNTSYTEGVNSI